MAVASLSVRGRTPSRDRLPGQRQSMARRRGARGLRIAIGRSTQNGRVTGRAAPHHFSKGWDAVSQCGIGGVLFGPVINADARTRSPAPSCWPSGA
jgi:hypothetical protein